MSYYYHDHNNYHYDDYDDNWNGDYHEGYDDSYYWDDYWYDDSYYDGYYDESYGDMNHHGYGGNYAGQSYHSYDESNSHLYGGGYGSGHEGGYGMYHGYNSHHPADGSQAWQTTTTQISRSLSSAQCDHHYQQLVPTPTPTHAPSAYMTSPVPPVPPVMPVLSTPTPPVMPVVSAPVPPTFPAAQPLRSVTPYPTGSDGSSRAMSINRDQQLTLQPANSPSMPTNSATPTESFFHNLFWKSPGKPRAGNGPTTPVRGPTPQRLPPSPRMTPPAFKAPASGPGSSPRLGYDMRQPAGIGFLAPSPA
ncbi:hypothetical protein PV04_02080 [Phialophora macrospora]|uniref:Uncharacterized protein n=1 Tax=Phialophora macrospora TaxID=1851006 RepID=A0A0D2GNS7_9EURO|nr:hypothetical protein PV04_02080 [Phialophora macrospora]